MPPPSVLFLGPGQTHVSDMISNVLSFVLDIASSLFGAALLLRAWAYAIRMHPLNPYLQAIFRLTDWLVHGIRKLVPSANRLDWASLIGAYLTAIVYMLLTNLLLTTALPDIGQLPALLVFSLFTVLMWACNLIIWGTIIQAILSWVNPMAPMMPLLNQLTAPLLNPIRRLLPNFGGLDFSPLVLIIVAQVAMMILRQMAFNSLAL